MVYLASYFDEISRDTGKYCFGIQDTISALEQGAVEKLIIWEHLDIKRYVFRNPNTEGTSFTCVKFHTVLCLKLRVWNILKFEFLAEDLKYLRPDQERDRTFFVDKDNGVELEVMETMEFIEWLVETDET